MRCFRSHRRLGGWAALFALLLQLGLSFGHVHGAAPDHPTVALAADTGNSAQPHTDTRHPADPDYCATCSILTLLTGAQTASAPVAALPIAPAAAESDFTRQASRIIAARTAFYSRAPPLS